MKSASRSVWFTETIKMLPSVTESIMFISIGIPRLCLSSPCFPSANHVETVLEVLLGLKAARCNGKHFVHLHRDASPRFPFSCNKFYSSFVMQFFPSANHMEAVLELLLGLKAARRNRKNISFISIEDAYAEVSLPPWNEFHLGVSGYNWFPPAGQLEAVARTPLSV
ncbi:hypothetical protein Tsp_12294 [Trichinella spiralis]|uniref:hypothetical protein n=1 Tax=Trichinella spiralis TaxID=6334 RepID=UPI0001EFD80D|nr:hypothetical protein Tsp_12294 [Trichinella spiralis]